MPAEIETMMYAAQDGVPWHGLGTPVEGYPTSEEAIVAAGLDWEVETGDLYAGPDKAHIRKVPNRRSIYRSTDRQMFGIASPRFTPLQNKEAFAWVDSLVADGVVGYAAAGALFGGRIVWLLAQMQEDWRVADDDYRKYFLLVNQHDGKGSVRVTVTDVRAICANTVANAFMTDGERLRMYHTPSLPQQMAEASTLFAVSTEAQRRMKTYLEKALTQRVTKAQREAVITHLLGAGSLDDDAGTRRQNAVARFDEIHTEEIARTGKYRYALYNAATGFADHARSYRMSGNTPEDRAAANKERRFYNTLLGRTARRKRELPEVIAAA